MSDPTFYPEWALEAAAIALSAELSAKEATGRAVAAAILGAYESGLAALASQGCLVCVMCGDDTTRMNDYPHHSPTCPYRTEKYARETSVADLAKRIRDLNAVAFAAGLYVFECGFCEPACVASGGEFGPIVDAMVVAGLMERCPDGRVRKLGVLDPDVWPLA